MNKGSAIALDVGGKRIGVALASLEARLASPLTTLDVADFLPELKKIISAESVQIIVIGLPRNLNGQETDQSREIQTFAENIKQLGLPVYFQDESVTSRQAEAELQARGKPYQKGDIDALAATYILEDWLNEHKQGIIE